MTDRNRQPRILRGDERIEFLSAFSVDGESPPRYKTPHRDWLMTRLMLEAGLRTAEVTHLRPHNFDAAGCALHVRVAKGGKERTVGLGWDLCRSLSRWMVRRQRDYPESEWLFPTSSGGRVDTSHLRRRVKRAARDAGLREADRVHPHCLRHSCAVHMRKHGASLEEIQHHLGHERLSTTERYLAGLDVSHVEAAQRIQNGASDGEGDDAAADDVPELARALAELDPDGRAALKSALAAING